MKTFTPEERIRLNFLYDLLELNYRVLREAAQIQRGAILHGCVAATVIADMDLVHLSRANCAAWSEIQFILNPPARGAAEPAPDAPPESDPKETIQ